MALTFNPVITTVASGGFSVQSQGFVQGMSMDDPATRFALASGVLATTETLPMWGGVGIVENIATSGSAGGLITRATSTAAITGFSTFDQAHNWVNTPQSPVPSAAGSMDVNFYRLGSGRRLAVACEPTLATTLATSGITTQVSWDIYNQRLQAYNASTSTVSVTSITSSYSNGVYTFVVVAAAAADVVGVGDAINVSGVTGTGASLVNGNQIITSFTDNQHFSFQVTAASGAIATGSLSGTIVLNQSSGALAVKVLRVDVGNSKTVNYDPVTGFVTWNPTGAVAIIQL